MPPSADDMGAVISGLNSLSVAATNYLKYPFVARNPTAQLISHKEDGDDEPNWLLESWYLHSNGDVLPWSDIYQLVQLKTTGNLDKLFEPLDWKDFKPDFSSSTDWYLYLEDKKSLQDLIFEMESLHPRLLQYSNRANFHQMLRLFRHLHREKYNEDERSDDARRKAPTFSKYNRSREARDYHLSKKFGKKEKYPRLSLMGLPTEVRLVILEELFSTLEIDAWGAGENGSLNLLRARFGKWNAVSNPLAILLTCRELYFEGHKIFQEKTLFRSKLEQVEQLDPHERRMLKIIGFGPYEWNVRKYQKMLPNLKRWHIQIKNPEYHCEESSNILWVPISYQYEIQAVVEKQASEALRDGNKLLELTVDLEPGNGKSSSMSDYFIKKHAIDALLAFTGSVKVMRITGEIPESLKKYARDTEIDIQGYDDTPPKPVVKELEDSKEESNETVG